MTSRLVSLIAKAPVLNKSSVELGLELLQVSDFEADEDELLLLGTTGPTGDLTETNFAVQWSTQSDYLGYKLILQSGFRLTRSSEELIDIVDNEVDKVTESQTTGTTFLTIFAGLD